MAGAMGGPGQPAAPSYATPPPSAAAPAGIPPAITAIPHYSPHRTIRKRKMIGTIIGIVVLLAAAGGGVFAIVWVNQQKQPAAPAIKADAKKSQDANRKPVITGSDNGAGRPAPAGAESDPADNSPPRPKVTGAESPDQPKNPDDNPPPDSPTDGSSSSGSGPATTVPSGGLKFADLKLTADEHNNAYLSGSVTSSQAAIVQAAHVRAWFHNGDGVRYARDAEGLPKELDFAAPLAVLPPGQAVPFATKFEGVSASDVATFVLDKTTFDVQDVVLADARCRTVNVSDMVLVRGAEDEDDVVTCKVLNPHKVGLMNVMVCVDLTDPAGRPTGRAYGLVNDGALIGPGQSSLARIKVNEQVIATKVTCQGRGFGLPAGE